MAKFIVSAPLIALIFIVSQLIILYNLYSFKAYVSDKIMQLQEPDESMYERNNKSVQIRKIFIDLGAYTGDSLWEFIKFRQDSNEYIGYVWEAQKANLNTLVKNINSNPDYNKDLKYISIIPKAVWIKDVGLDFEGEELGGHIVVNDKPKYDSNTNALQFSKWLENHVNINDYVFLKIDIECVEFLLLKDLFETNTIDLIDEIQMEWHDRKNECNTIGVKGNLTERQELRYKLHKELNQNGLIYQYATPPVDDIDEYRKYKIWQDVKKFIEEKQYPVPWVDLHYFRQQINPHLKSPWTLY